jgi:hypothetical protein
MLRNTEGKFIYTASRFFHERKRRLDPFHPKFRLIAAVVLPKSAYANDRPGMRVSFLPELEEGVEGLGGSEE